MKKSILLFVVVLMVACGYSQTVKFHENFELPSLADSVVSSGNPGWNVSSYLQHSGLRSDSSRVAQNDSTFLTTYAFSTIGYSNVILQFSHICKIEFFDIATIEVSNNNGITWTKLVGSQYLGTGFFTNDQFSASSYTDWLPGTPLAMPTNAWWKTEQFDLSAIAGNASQVKVRFKLKDGNGTGAGGNWGWMIDDIIVNCAISELVPPTITLNAPIQQDTVYTTGPFPVSAEITDASGIQWAKIAYKLDGAPQYDTVSMTNTTGNTYVGTIPSYTYHQKIWYHVVASDNSIVHNIGTNPSSGDKWFYTKQGPTVVIIGTGTTTETYLPIYGNYNWGWGVQLYKASEINMSGQIDSIAFYVGTVTAGYTMNNQKVFIGHTTASTYGTAQPDTSTMTVAFAGTCTFNGPGWYKIKLQNTFYYDGTSNLLIYWTNRDGSYVSGYPQWRYTATTDYMGAYKWSDTYSAVWPVSTGTQYYNRPNLRLAFIATNYQDDAGISQINEPVGIVLAATPLPVKVTVKNYGVDTLVKAGINWKLDGVMQIPYNWTGNLLQAVSSTPVTLGTQSFTPGSHIIKAWTVLPNDSVDENNLNDTISGSFYACNSILNGAYTIGGVGADFATFNDALVAMQNCGISGPVIFNVNTGTYNEQLSIPEITGASATNTITFQSSTGNYSDVILSYTATSAGNNYVIKLDGADYFRFKNMTLKANGTAYSTVLAAGNVSTHNIFNGNRFIGVTTTSSTSADNAVIYSASGTTSLDSVNTFNNNIIENGSYGIYWYGSGTTSLEKKSVFTNNQLLNQYYRGLYLYYQDASSIESNQITTSSGYATFYAMYIGYDDNNLKISKNIIQLYNGGYGIYLYYCDGVLGNEGLISNNMISIGGTNSTYGIYSTTSYYQNIYYNSINIYSNAATARAFYLTGGASLRLKDNIFVYTGVNAAGMAIYIATTTAIASSDYNDLFSTGTNLGYWTANRADLAAWKTASLKDTNSVSVNPGFVTPVNLHTFSTNVYNIGTPLAAVQDDIDGEARDLVTPCIGADEFNLLSYDVGIDSVLSPHASCQLTSVENMGVRIRNLGANPMSNIDVYYVINNGIPVHEVIAGPIASGSSLLYTFTTTANLSAYGNYYIDYYLSHALDQNALNDSLNNNFVYNGWDFYSSAYTQGFESNEYFSDWSVLSVNGDAYTWQIPYVSTTYSHTGSNSARFYNSSTNILGDWLFSRCFPLEAGVTYKMEFWYRAESASYPQTITVKYGNAATPAGMTSTLLTLSGYTNTAHQKATISFTPSTSGTYYIGWFANSPASAYYAFIDDINISIVPDQDATIIGITSPIAGCGLTSAEPVTIQIKNTGADTINGNLMATYKANGATPVSENVTGIILPGDTLDYTFTTLLNMSVTTSDSTFNIKAWTTLLNDPFHFNDTATVSVESFHVPANPVVVNDTIPYGNPAVLNAYSPDPVYWYINDTIPNYFYTGQTYTTPVLFDTTTYYVESSIGTGVSSLTTSFAGGNGCGGGQMFDLTALSNNITVSAFNINTNVTGSTTVNLYIKQGTYLGYETNAAAWTLQGSYTVNGMGSNVPTYMDVNDFTVPYGQTYGIYINVYTNYTTSTASYSNSDIAISTGAGLCSLFGGLNAGRAFNGTVFYSAGSGCHSDRIPVTAVVIIPAFDLKTAEIISPVDACTFGTETVTAKILNLGTNAINQPFTVGYKVSGNPIPVIETVNSVIAPGDSLIYTFTTPANMQVLSGDSTYHIKVFGSVTGDVYHLNDTLGKNVTLKYSPPDPAGTGASVPYGTTATLQATSPYSINWYDSPTGGTVLDTGSTFTTPVLYATTPYYAEATTTVPGGVTIIGTGTATEYYVPCYGYYNYSWSSSIYTSAELGFSGQIDTIAFYSTTTAPYTMLDQRIYMANVPYSSFATADPPVVTSMSNVFIGSITWSGSGWYKIALQTPFIYDGTSNLEIAWNNYDGSYVSGYPTFRYTATTTNMAKYDYLDANMPVDPGTLTLNRPNIYFGHMTQGCPSHRVQVDAIVTGQPNLDAGVIAITEPVSPTSLGVKNVKAVVQNFGLNTLTLVNIGWSVNGVSQTPYAWTGSLPTGATDTVTIGVYDFIYTPYPGLNDVKAWSYSPNGGTDFMALNDTSTVVIDAHDPYNGIYYILTNNPDFGSFNEAVAALSDWGVDGPVTILAEAGTYNEQISISPIPGASPTNIVSFESITGLNTDVTIQYAATGTADNFVLKLNGADYIRFRNMTIESTTLSSYGHVVELAGGANSNRFENNIIQSVVSTSSTTAPIYCYTSGADNHNWFIGNQILNGYYGVYFYGLSTNRKQGNHFVNNEISGWYYYGMYLYYNDSIQVIGNTITNGPASSTNYHIYSSYSDNGSRFERNNIISTGTGTFYGMYIYYNNATAILPNTYANNFISQTGSTGTSYGIYLYYSNYVNVYFNSVNVTSGTAARALYQTGGTSNNNIIDNNLANTAGGHAYYAATPAAINISNYNNLYTNGAVLAYWTADRANLAALQAASGKDQQSLSVMPGYYTVSNLHTYQSSLYSTGTPLAGISVDIDGDPRNAATPCIGADEFFPPALDAGILSIDYPVSPATAGLNDIKVTLKNFGLDTLHNVTISWEVDGVAGTPYSWAGTLVTPDTVANLLIGTTTLSAGTTVIRAWTSMPNGGADALNINDTAEAHVLVCNGPLSGNYTIGGVNPDYPSFNDAVNALSVCGVGGPVVFNAADGNYTEHIFIPAITGVSAINTVTFQSAGGIANNVVLKYAATGTADNYVVQLNGADYITFRNITLQSITNSTYGRVVVVSNNSDYNSFDSDQILSISATSSNAAAIYSTGGNCDYNTFIGNNIFGGYYGAYWYAASAAYNKGTEFRDNSITGWYYYGMYMYYNDSMTVAGNTLQNSTTSATNYHIYCNYGANGCSILKNKIIGNGTGTFYGIYLYYCAGSLTEPNIVANNMISQSTGTGTAYGMYLYYTSYTNLYYNTINITAGSATAGRALYVYTGSSNINVLNNILVNTGGGHAYYVYSPALVLQSDHNDIYTTSGNFAYWGGTVATLAALQTLSGKDSNSVSDDPIFVSATDLHVNGTGVNGLAVPIANIPDDIDGDIRNVTTPDIGADEYTPQQLDIAVTAILQPAMAYTSEGNSVVVQATVRNFGTDTIHTFSLSYQYALNAPVTAVWNGTLLPNQTTNYTFSTLFTALAGTYDLCVYCDLTGDADHTNDTLCKSFLGMSLFNLPYTDNFEGMNYWMGADGTGQWEYGIPASTVINSAHSPVHAWKTNLDGTYVANMNDNLYSPVFNLSPLMDTVTLSFWQWYDTQLNYDAGRVQYSLNGGATWVTLGYVGDPLGSNWYNSNISGQAGWSGSSAGWVQSFYRIPKNSSFGNFNSPIQFRFNFFSNASTQNDGWAIDDFAFTIVLLPEDAGVVEIVQPAGSTPMYSSVNVAVKIANFGSDTLTNVPVAYKVNATTPVTGVYSGTLLPGDTVLYSFTTSYTSPATAYNLCAYTDISADTHLFNDTTCDGLTVTAALIDAGITKIVQPTGPITTIGANTTVKATIKNFGVNTLTSIPVAYTINGGTPVTETWTGNLVSGDSIDYTFTTTYLPPIIQFYTLCVKTVVPNDPLATNDQKCRQYNNNVGIEETASNGIVLGQNIPNPAMDQTTIDYYVPVNGKAVFAVLNSIGQIIYTKESSIDAGSHQIKLNTGGWGAGVYYYMLDFNGTRLYKKMILTK